MPAETSFNEPTLYAEEQYGLKFACYSMNYFIIHECRSRIIWRTHVMPIRRPFSRSLNTATSISCRCCGTNRSCGGATYRPKNIQAFIIWRVSTRKYSCSSVALPSGSHPSFYLFSSSCKLCMTGLKSIILRSRTIQRSLIPYQRYLQSNHDHIHRTHFLPLSRSSVPLELCYSSTLMSNPCNCKVGEKIY